MIELRPVIELRDVIKTHHSGPGTVYALRGVSHDIPAGAFTFIVGPSGSGKSTLLYLIGALDVPTSGEIRVNGRGLDRLTAAERDAYRRDDVGFVFQNFNLLANLTAVENVLVPFLPAGVSPAMRARAVAMLEKVGLGERVEHKPHQLSGGEQQRVAIARAILKRPLLILADEPTGELDSQTGGEVFQLLRQLNREEQATVVVVTHDRRYIEPQDHVVRMLDGRIEGDGKTEHAGEPKIGTKEVASSKPAS